MNYKQKAKELFDKIDVEVSKGSYDGWYDKRISIQCALITVDEIITTLDLMELTETGAVTNSLGQENWQQVRQEIELLKE